MNARWRTELPRELARVAFHAGVASALFVTAFQPFLSLAVTGEVRPAWTASFFLFVWIMYLADRLRSNPEDQQEADGNAAAFVRRHRRSMLGLCAALAVGQALLVIGDPRLLARLALALAISSVYIVRLPFLGRRVKEIAYLKCFYLAGTALVLVGLFTPHLLAALDARTSLLLGACFSLYFLNFSLYDVKDVEADRRANIKTLAGACSPGLFLRAQLLGALLTLAAVLLLLPAPLSGVLASVALFHLAATAWLSRHPFDGAMCGIVDGGYGTIVGLGTLVLLLQR
jgi:hypothetical protein